MKKRILSIFGLVAFVIAPLFAGAAIADLEAIKPDGFARAVAFTVDGYAGSSTLADFPVLVRISETAIPGFDYDEMMFPSNGDDLCFVAEDGTPLAFDIDTWNPAGESLVWVKLPSMANGTEFAMFWRSSRSGKSVCDGNAFNNYVGVWHLNETGNGAQTIYDSTTNALTASSSELSYGHAAGKIGGSRQIINQRDKLDKGIKVTKTDAAMSALDTLGTNFVASFWAKPFGSIDNQNGNQKKVDATTGAGIGYDVLISRKSAGNCPAWGVQLSDSFSANGVSARLYTSQTGNPSYSGVNFAFQQGVWGKCDIVYSTVGTKTKVTTYWNGVKTFTSGDLDVVKQGSVTLDRKSVV